MSCYISPRVDVVGKVITMYHSGHPLDGYELECYRKLLADLPPRPDCGIVLHKWGTFYPNVQYNGVMIGLRDVTTPYSQELLIPFNEFDMRSVPWEKLNPLGLCA